jgi:hypothetical protein
VGNIERKLVMGNITLGYLKANTNAFAYDVVAQGLGHHNNLTMGHGFSTKIGHMLHKA